jgi:hypothetical protein
VCAGHPRRCDGKTLVRAIEALSTIQPSGPFERAPARLLMAAYRRRLRAIVAAAPTWVGEEILSAGDCRLFRNPSRLLARVSW